MKYLINELFNYINIDILNKDQLVDLFTNLAYEVEEIIPANIITGVKIGKTIECSDHPDADTLSYCKVKTNKEVMDVVCGGANIATGQIVAHALPGSKVGDLELQPKKIRGIVSNGMILSISEIGNFDKDLVEDAERDNIVVFDDATDINSDVASLVNMNTEIYDLSILPDRQYASNYIKLAQEMSAFINAEFVLPNTNFKASISNETKHDLSKDASFSATINIKESVTPMKVKAVLYHANIKPLNTIVDILEYVKLLTGNEFILEENNLTFNADTTIKGSNVDLVEFAVKYSIVLGKEALYIEDSSSVNGVINITSNTIKLNKEKINSYLGIEINFEEVKPTLEKLGFELSDNSVVVPPYRHDVKTQQDFIEEIMRVYGISNVKEEPISKTNNKINVEKHALAQRNITNELIKYGFSDVKTYELVSYQDAVQYNIHNINKFIKLNDKYNVEYNTVQTSLLKGLIDVHIFNYRNNQEDIRLFEFANIFNNKIPTYTLGILHDTKINEDEPILATKELIRHTIVSLGLDLSKLSFIELENSLFNKFVSATILYDNTNIGVIGEIHPKLLREFKYIRIDKVKEKLYYAEIKVGDII